MDHYIILRINPSYPTKRLVWNYRRQTWSDRVTNGCRYKGQRRGRAGLMTPKACDDALAALSHVNDYGVQCFLERYLRDPTRCGTWQSEGLIFE